MVGYAYIDNNWHVCLFENRKLFILKTRCNRPIALIGDVNIPSNLIFALCEDNFAYYFDTSSSTKTQLFSEYYEYVYSDINYFVLEDVTGDCSLGKIKKISLVGGIIPAMLQSRDVLEFSLPYKSKQLKIIFNRRKENVNDVCDIGIGKMILDSESNLTKYSIDVEFDATDDLGFVYYIINRLYDLVRFINCDYQPYIQKIEVQVETKTLHYFNRNINYDCVKVANHNSIGNIRNKVENTLKFVLKNEKIKYDFLGLLEKKEINFAETNILAEAIESIVDHSDCNFSGELKQEVDLYVKLKAEIKKTIDNFEKENGALDNDKKNSILSLIEMARFRQKVEYLLLEYNKFAQNYPSFYSDISEFDIKAISKDIQTERNNIHGNNCHVDPPKYFLEVQYVLFGLIIYIAKKNRLDDSEIFNLYNDSFKHRLGSQPSIYRIVKK